MGVLFKQDFILNGMCCTFSLHAHGQALLVAAVLTAVPLALIDNTVLVVTAGVGQVLANGSFEETFAAFTTVDTIVFSWKREKMEDVCLGF